MYEDVDYNALERNVKYTLEGKERGMVHLAQDISGSCYDGQLSWNSSRVPSDEDAKTFAGLTEMTSAQKKKFNNYKLNIRAYADLLQCCTQDIISFGIVDAAKDKELSNLRDKTMRKKWN